jgi:hypothetical protein
MTVRELREAFDGIDTLHIDSLRRPLETGFYGR